MVSINFKSAFLSLAMAAAIGLSATAASFAQEANNVELQASNSSQARQIVGVKKKFDVYDLTEEIEQCAKVIGRIPRLICYDNLSTALGYTPPEEADREEIILATYGFWEATKKLNPAGEEIYYLKNDSVKDIISDSGLKRKATLVVQCRNGITDFYLDWKSKLLPQGNLNRSTMVITYQLDGERRKAAKWELSMDQNALFVPEPIPFLRNLQHYKRFILTVTPPNESTQVIVHDIGGLSDALNLIVRECYEIKP